MSTEDLEPEPDEAYLEFEEADYEPEPPGRDWRVALAMSLVFRLWLPLPGSALTLCNRSGPGLPTGRLPASRALGLDEPPSGFLSVFWRWEF